MTWNPPSPPSGPAAGYYGTPAGMPVRPLRNVAGLARALRVLLPIAAVVYLLNGVVGLFVARAQAEDARALFNEGSLLSSQTTTTRPIVAIGSLIGFVEFALQVAVLVCLIVWLHRIVSNNQALNGTVRWSPGWAIGAWFIPVAFYVLPYLVVSSAYNSTEEVSESGDRTALNLWWWPWVLANVASVGVSAYLVARFGVAALGGTLTRTSDVGNLYADAVTIQGYVSLAVGMLGCLAGLFGMQMVRGLTGRQERLAAARGTHL